ncbi:leucine carboxyl methyltransferase 1 homolog [Trichonephila clavipes]|uniref:[phosphatase 2A protein]-leucine-carboxy methyltransferase n=1 Tax=Trichonephila clavipes TaxID=2585209 RepID=A0A8X6WBP5_TRICX|nr:leucine carboxyl methyltransferase 1 homolog [Trichonephila clavipes]
MLVQNTNDSSIVSKLSAANKGYFLDQWLKMFVDKEQKRSPIINRGYYIRFKAIEALFQSWFNEVPVSIYPKSQIISLGAGFDSSYFRLKKLNVFPPGCKYIEIDYRDVLKRKIEYIAKSEFSHLLNICNKQVERNSNILLSSDEYVMLGVDLQNCKELETCFCDLEIDFNIPTLFLSECALTYINLKSSNNLIQWVQAHFLNSAFVLYEQVHDDDGFSLVM